MGKRSTKKNKNVFFQAREDLGLSRSEAADLMPGFSESQIEKIENERTISIDPDMVLAMAKAYKKPELCNQYCSRYCSIGKDVKPEIQVSNLSQIVLGMLSTMNSFENKKNKLIDISVDGEITENELYDYVTIQYELDQMSTSIEALRLWIAQKIEAGNIDSSKIEQIRNEIKTSAL